ncbi:protein ALP1-like [Cryptotermes secundus]|nr:protein ALP1-like [Cryptotermes secundus]
MGETTVRRIVYETCEVIWEVLSPIVMPPPTKEIWGHISSRIWDKWQYPNALGAMDGKHVVFEKPGGSGSTFFNYKKEFSVALLALVDADYKFVVVDVGAHGRTSDGAVFFRSRLGKMLTEGTLDIPVPKSLPNEPEIVLPHVIVADEAFPLQENIMRPYPGPQVVNNERNKIYNYRHSRFRRESENAFGVISKKFRIYRRKLQISPDNLDKVILATTCLHNFLCGDDEYLWQPGKLEASVESLRLEDIPRIGGRPSDVAYAVREQLKTYFVSRAGSVIWCTEEGDNYPVILKPSC